MTAYLELFELTHSLTGGLGWAMWQRTALPAEGGVEDQPAKVMQALTFLCDQRNRIVDERRPQRKKKRTKKTDG